MNTGETIERLWYHDAEEVVVEMLRQNAPNDIEGHIVASVSQMRRIVRRRSANVPVFFVIKKIAPLCKLSSSPSDATTLVGNERDET